MNGNDTGVVGESCCIYYYGRFLRLLFACCGFFLVGFLFVCLFVCLFERFYEVGGNY